MVVARSPRRIRGAPAWAAAAGLLALFLMPPLPAGAARAAAPDAVDISGTPAGARAVQVAQRRLAAAGFALPLTDLRAWRDGAGTLVAPRDADLLRVSSTAAGAGTATDLVPLAQPRGRTVGARSLAAVDDQPMAWSLVFSQCYERISDTWSWLDHCARIYRLAGDGDPGHDFYGLQRVATAGANAPWVVKSAGIAATPVDSTLMSWVDWSPRGDRSGPCQAFVVWVTAPFAGLTVPLDRCETWDISKGVHGGDFRLDWHGCACTHERALAFDVVVSVPQGRNPAWYVPAEVHGFPF